MSYNDSRNDSLNLKEQPKLIYNLKTKRQYICYKADKLSYSSLTRFSTTQLAHKCDLKAVKSLFKESLIMQKSILCQSLICHRCFKY